MDKVILDPESSRKAQEDTHALWTEHLAKLTRLLLDQGMDNSNMEEANSIGRRMKALEYVVLRLQGSEAIHQLFGILDEGPTEWIEED